MPNKKQPEPKRGRVLTTPALPSDEAALKDYLKAPPVNNAGTAQAKRPRRLQWAVRDDLINRLKAHAALANLKNSAAMEEAIEEYLEKRQA